LSSVVVVWKDSLFCQPACPKDNEFVRRAACTNVTGAHALCRAGVKRLVEEWYGTGSVGAQPSTVVGSSVFTLGSVDGNGWARTRGALSALQGQAVARGGILNTNGSHHMGAVPLCISCSLPNSKSSHLLLSLESTSPVPPSQNACVGVVLHLACRPYSIDFELPLLHVSLSSSATA
jgi:hypothetical protein